MTLEPVLLDDSKRDSEVCVSEDSYLKMYSKISYKMRLSEYRKSIQRFIMTSRFNSATWNENRKYRTQYPKFGCIYCSPCPVSSTVPIDSVMFVIEMNKDENSIIGIGIVKNHPQTNGLFV